MSKPTQSVYRTAKGTHIDMLKLINQNEMTVAVGNMKVNARGDKIGKGGQIIAKREEVLKPGVQTQVIQSGKKNIDNMDPEGNE